MSRDILIDLRTLPAGILKPIRGWANDYLAIPRSAHRVRLFGLEFTICWYRRSPLMRLSKLEAVFDAHAKTAQASERVLREQTRELEVRQERDLAQSHTDFLARMSPDDRGLLAARLAAKSEAETRVARQHDAILAERDQLTRERDALRREPDQAKA